MTTYRLYYKSTITDDESTAVDPILVSIGQGEGGSPAAALRSWWKIASEAGRDSIEGQVIVAVPASNHHEITLSVERQTRLVLS